MKTKQYIQPATVVYMTRLESVMGNTVSTPKTDMNEDYNMRGAQSGKDFDDFDDFDDRDPWED